MLNMDLILQTKYKTTLILIGASYKLLCIWYIVHTHGLSRVNPQLSKRPI